MSKYDERPRLDDLEETPKKQRKKFNIFDVLYGKEQVEDDPGDQDAERNFSFFFKLTKRNLRRLFSLNLMMVIANFPVFIIMLAFSQNLHKTAMIPASPLAGPLYGAAQFGAASPAASALFGLHGVQMPIAYWTPLALTVLIIGGVLLLFTFGLSTIGITYIMRNVVRGEMIFMKEDFFYAMKRNLRQGIILGILDLLFTALLLYDIYFFYLNLAGGTWAVMGFWASIVILLFYFFMRFYTYLQALTFELSLAKVFKNALIFSILGFKRNILAFLGIAVVVVLNFMIAEVLMPVGIILPFFISVSLSMFMAIYAAWPVIQRYMIDAYDRPADDGDEDEENDEFTQSSEV
ncbi:MAG: DUF624 domain-containing protein [Clostridia bacterium]|nr:DUF624 domain-containing protein [Clostridia bacterium]